MNYSRPKKFSTALLFLFSLSLFSAGALWTENAEAHKGHAGKKITFIKKKAVLKAMLPAGGKVYRRKQSLNSNQIDWASKTYGTDLSSKVIPFYVSKNRDTKQQIGSAIIYKFTYRHGSCELAVGLDSNNKVTTSAFVSINEKYFVDFEETVGTGLLKSFDGMSVADLVDNAKKQSKEDKATREFANAMKEAAVILAAFQQK